MTTWVGMPTATRPWRAHREWLRLGGAERAAAMCARQARTLAAAATAAERPPTLPAAHAQPAAARSAITPSVRRNSLDQPVALRVIRSTP
jgi:hypothetical protein